MTTGTKAYKGLGMEGVIARWYATNTGRDRRRFESSAAIVAAQTTPGARVLEVAPGPGYLSVELARRGYVVTGLDISRTFVRIAQANANRAQVPVRFEQGDAAHMPFPDAAFDFIVCTAAFKNFTDPVGALDEMYRVLRVGGKASIQDLRQDATPQAIEEEIRRMNLSRVNAVLTRWTFHHLLLKRAYSRHALEGLVARSRFGTGEVVDQGIGFELRLERRR